MSKIVGRTLDFLEVFADQKRPLSLSEIARLLSIPASSCHDVLQAMQERGYIYELTPRGGYYPTRRIYDLAKAISDHEPVVLRAEVLLRGLRDMVDESILLSKVSGLQATYLLAFEPSHQLRFLARAGDMVRTLYATSAGKALLAGLSEEALDAYLKSTPLTAITPRTITSKSVLKKDLAAGNKRGWFLNQEESQDEIITISARFLSISTTYIVTIAGPKYRMEQKIDKVGEILINFCQQLGQAPGTG